MADKYDKCKWCEHKADAQMWKIIACVGLSVIVGFALSALWIF